MSTAPDPAPGGGPVSPAGLPSRKPLIVAAVGGVIVVVVAAVALLRDPPKGDDVVVDTAAVSVAADGRPLIPAYDTKEPLSIMQVELPATWIDVSSPQALRSLLTENAWLKGVTSSPLGRGFLGSWGAFFGSSNEDLGLSKLGQGLLGDMVAERLLTQPMRLTWFSGSSGTPALVVPKPSSALTSTVATLTATMQRGGFLLDQCPGEPAVTDDKQKLSIVRWIVADHTVFVAVGRDRLVVARNQDTAANALCSPLPEIKVDAPDGDPHAFVERFRDIARFEGARLSTIDGVRVDWPDGWGLVRASNTTPVLVMRFDADSNPAMARIQAAFREQLLAVQPGMTLPF